MHEFHEKQYWDTVENAGEFKRTPNHPVVQLFSQQRISYLKKHMDFNEISNALDVGCGTGFSSFGFPLQNLIGIDFSFRNLEINPMSEKIQSSAYSLPFKSDSFDLVYGWDFLHHLDDPEKCIEEMARLTRRYLVLFEPNSENLIQLLYAYSNKNERGTLNFHSKKLVQLINDIEFKILSCDNVGWIFAGATPKFLLNIFSRLPFIHKFGISSVIIAEKS